MKRQRCGVKFSTVGVNPTLKTPKPEASSPIIQKGKGAPWRGLREQTRTRRKKGRERQRDICRLQRLWGCNGDTPHVVSHRQTRRGLRRSARAQGEGLRALHPNAKQASKQTDADAESRPPAGGGALQLCERVKERERRGGFLFW